MKKDILVFGDSIAYGVGDPDLGGWVDLLKRYTWKHKPNLNVYNFCIDGNSSRDLLSRLSTQSSQTLYKKEAIFIAIGINDSVTYSDGQNFMSDIEFKDNLDKIILQSKVFTKNIYLVGLTRVNEKITAPFADSRTGKTYTNERILEFNDILEEVSKEKDIKFVKMIDVIKEDKDMFDGLHVNTMGQEKMFSRILDTIHFLS